MRKFLLSLIFCCSICSCVFAANVSVQLNGEIINFTDENGASVDAQIVNSRTMVPMRKIFELLGAEITWYGDTSTVVAQKNDIEIKLQINNENAEVKKNGETKNIKLDSKPIIVENRTLVPLRFISESLGKDVYFDSKTTTAIIIDYDYFENRLKEKSPIFYESIKKMPTSTSQISVTKEYIDLKNQSLNTVSKVNANITKKSNNNEIVNLNFSGTSELFKDIVNEGWGNVNLELRYDDKNVYYYINESDPLKKMITTSENSYEELNLIGTANTSFSDAMKKILSIDEKNVNVNTFTRIKSEYDNFLNLFTFTNSSSSTTGSSKSINFSNSNNSYFDYTMFDNVIIENEFSRVYNVINKLIFNYDVTLNELLYDTSSIVANINVTKSEKEYETLIRIETQNEYDEKIIYSVEIINN